MHVFERGEVTQEGPKRFRSVAFSDASTTTSYDYFDYGYNWSEEVQAGFLSFSTVVEPGS